MRRVPPDDMPVLARDGRDRLGGRAVRSAARNKRWRVWDGVFAEQLAAYLKPENLCEC